MGTERWPIQWAIPDDCKVKGCKTRVYRRGMCRPHYREISRREQMAGKSIAEKDLDSALELLGKRKPRKPDQVYAVRAENGLVKIGVSRNPRSRLSSMQVGSAVKIELLGAVQGGAGLESKIHDFLSSHRAHGEWFKPEGAVTLVVACIKAKEINKLREILDNAGEIQENPT